MFSQQPKLFTEACDFRFDIFWIAADDIIRSSTAETNYRARTWMEWKGGTERDKQEFCIHFWSVVMLKIEILSIKKKETSFKWTGVDLGVMSIFCRACD